MDTALFLAMHKEFPELDVKKIDDYIEFIAKNNLRDFKRELRDSYNEGYEDGKEAGRNDD